VLVAAAGALTLSVGVLPAQASPAAVRWQLTHTIGATSSWPVSFTNLVATGKHDAWLAGTANNSGPGGLKPLVERWNGSSWRKMQITAPVSFTAITGFGAASSKDAWAFTENSKVALHWNGVAWKTMAIPSWLLPELGGGGIDVTEATVQILSPADVLVFNDGVGHYAGRYNGSTWSKFKLPGVATGVRVVSRDDIWIEAAPSPVSNKFFLAHWNGHAWHRLGIPGLGAHGGYAFLDWASGPANLWLARIGTKGTQYWQHWNGKTWSRRYPPRGQALASLVPDGHGGFWSEGTGPAPAHRSYFWHWAAGHWTRQLVPGTASVQNGSIEGIVRLPGTTTMLAAGQANNAKYGPFLAIWQNGRNY
jgi:hypothetical protein